MKSSVAGLAAILLGTSATANAQGAPSFAYAELKDGQIRSGASGSDRPGALYQAGSIAKYACTVAILRLADQERLDIDNPLVTILPGLAGQGAAGVTVRQLLANRSGLPDNLMPQIKRDLAGVQAVKNTAEAIPKFTFGKLAAEPGTRYSYDLVNWIYVQAVIEKVTGGPLSDAMERFVFHPAGLNHTFVFTGNVGPKAQTPVEPANALPAFLKCAGGIASTPGELIALLRFANTGGLSQQSLNALRTVTTPEENYTLGGHVQQNGDRLLDWKTGSNGPYKSVAVYDPATDTGFAAMSARDEWDAIRAARDGWVGGVSVIGVPKPGAE